MGLTVSCQGALASQSAAGKTQLPRINGIAMQFFGYAIAVWSIIILCGLPFALISLPPGLRPFALGTAPTFGYCYIVYFGYLLYRSDIGGTDFCAQLVICLPLGLLAFLAWRQRVSADLIFGHHSIVMLASPWLRSRCSLRFSCLHMAAPFRWRSRISTSWSMPGQSPLPTGI